MRPLNELINTREDAWPEFQKWLKTAVNTVEVLELCHDQGDKALLETQVTTRSFMGAIINHSGGLLIDSGWLRVLGSGSHRLKRSLPGWNAAVDNKFPPAGFILIADDAAGGFFALRGSGGKPGTVYYSLPDMVEWEDTEKSYSDFLYWCLHGDLEQFYSGLRWSGWREEVADLDGDSGYFFFPPLFAEGPELDGRERQKVPIAELYAANVEILGLVNHIR